MPAKAIKKIPPGEKRTSFGIFLNHFPEELPKQGWKQAYSDQPKR
jgi:hypothetical protein